MDSVIDYLSSDEQAKLYYLQEQMNKGLPMTEQKTVNQILAEWIRARLAAHEIVSDLKEIAEGNIKALVGEDVLSEEG